MGVTLSGLVRLQESSRRFLKNDVPPPDSPTTTSRVWSRVTPDGKFSVENSEEARNVKRDLTSSMMSNPVEGRRRR